MSIDCPIYLTYPESMCCDVQLLEEKCVCGSIHIICTYGIFRLHCWDQ